MAGQQALFCAGNPLLDIIADVDAALLAKYKLGINGFCFVGPDQAGYYEALEKTPAVQYIAGGAGLNSTRIFAGLAGEKNVAFYSGAVGDDDSGSRMKRLCDDEGVVTSFCVDKEHPTGICGVGVVGTNRSMCTRLGAADHYPVAHLKDHAWKMVETADFFYFSGFFLTVCAEGIKLVGEHSMEKKKLFCTNLSATFLVDHFHKPMMETFFYADYVFGNEEEWAAFGKKNGYECDDLAEIAKRAAQLPKAQSHRPRVVVVTQGAKPTIVVQSDNLKPARFDVVPVAESQIVDTNAAGDAFVGGFLYGLSGWGGGNLESAIFYAHYAASHIIQRSGCTFDFKDKPSFPTKK